MAFLRFGIGIPSNDIPGIGVVIPEDSIEIPGNDLPKGMLRNGIPRNGIPRNGIPRNGNPRNGSPRNQDGQSPDPLFPTGLEGFCRHLRGFASI